MRFIDFFSGIGGFRRGMEMAGHECVGHCEIDKYADKSYRAMHSPKEGEWFANDITRVIPGELPDADCYCGGFPCQSFSIAGKRGGFSDTRGTLFFEVMRLAAERQPKYLFLENVAGLLSHDNGNTFATICNSFAECGYEFQWAVLNSKDFGVPQNRERVFFVANLRGTNRPQVFPIRESNEVDAKEVDKGTHNYIREITVLSDSGQGRRWREQDFISALRVGGDTQCVVIQDENLMIRDGRDNRSCLRAGRTPELGIKGTSIRRLTPLECFRLQGFPDEYFYRAKAVNSDSQLYKQAGNSVTVNVIYEIAKRIESSEGD